MALVIEVVNADDPRARALLELYFAELSIRLGGFDPDDYAAPAGDMAAPHGAFLLMSDDGAPAACGGVRLFEGNTYEVKRMFVRREARGRGLGRQLLSALEEAARKLGATRIVLDTASPLHESASLYRSAGYHDVPAYNANPSAAHWFAKDLSLL